MDWIYCDPERNEMRLFGSRDEHHETPCNSMSRPGNPMGWGSDEPRVVARGGSARRQRMDREPSSHAQQRPALGAIRWGRGGGFVRVTGEKPGGGRQR
jgi:hypothetical protein